MKPFVLPPSGHQFNVGPWTVVSLGGGLRCGPGIDGFELDELPRGARGHILAPWPNRIQGGTWQWNDQDLLLPITERSKGTANHGLVRWADWREVEYQPGVRVVLEHMLAPWPGYPFRIQLRVTYEAVDNAELQFSLEATNLSAWPAPFAAGFHPYLTAGTAFVDDCSISARASLLLRRDDLGAPAALEHIDGFEETIGSARLEFTLGGMQVDSDARWWATLRCGGTAVSLWADSAWKWCQIYSGDTLHAHKRRQGLAVQPMTSPPNALVDKTDLVILAPGVPWRARCGIVVS